MNKRMITMISAWSVTVLFGLFAPSNSGAEVNVNINVPLPGVVFSASPALVVIPGTYAYFAPDVAVDIFFYQGYWYRPYDGRWYVAADYRGPWGFIAVNRVPPVFLNLPPGYRHVPPGYDHMPYGMVKKNWRRWERERYWDRDDGPGHGHGRGHGHGWGHGMHGDD